MKTTHQIAKELLALPDVELVVEGWCNMGGHELTAKMTGYDPENTAILIQKCVDPEAKEEMRKWLKDHAEVVWHSINYGDRTRDKKHTMSRTRDITISDFDLDRIEAELKLVQNENTKLQEECKKIQEQLEADRGLEFFAIALERDRLRYAAQAVVDRWETPTWKNVEPTAKVIYRLRDVLNACTS